MTNALVFECTPPSYVWTGTVIKPTRCLTNHVWTTVPLLIYYTMRAWERSAHQSEQPPCFYIDSSPSIYTSPWFRTTLITNAAPPRKGRDSVELTALSTEIPETPRTDDSSTSYSPTNAWNSTKGNYQRLFKAQRRNKKTKLKIKKTENPDRWRQEENTKRKQTS